MQGRGKTHVYGEVGACRVRDPRGFDLVIGQPRVLVDADGLAALAVRLLVVEVLGIDATKDVKPVAMIGGNQDQSGLELANGLEVLDGAADGVVELQEVAQGTVVVEGVHLLVDGGRLGHEEEALVAAALVEDVDSL